MQILRLWAQHFHKIPRDFFAYLQKRHTELPHLKCPPNAPFQKCVILWMTSLSVPDSVGFIQMSTFVVSL